MNKRSFWIATGSLSALAFGAGAAVAAGGPEAPQDLGRSVTDRAAVLDTASAATAD
jgi:hypothetical protein